jgi:hypothetical protein
MQFIQIIESMKSQTIKETKEKNTGNSQMKPSTAMLSSTSVLTPRHQMATPSMHLATTIESSSEAQSQDVMRNKSFPSDLASQFG